MAGMDLDRTVEELRAIRDDQILSDRCLGAPLLDFADREGKRFVLLVENLNTPSAMSWLQNRRETLPAAAAIRLVLSSARDRDLDRADSIIKTLNAILDRTKVLADISMQRQDQRAYTYAGSDYRRHQDAEGDPLFSAHVIDYTTERGSGIS